MNPVLQVIITGLYLMAGCAVYALLAYPVYKREGDGENDLLAIFSIIAWPFVVVVFAAFWICFRVRDPLDWLRSFSDRDTVIYDKTEPPTQTEETT